MAFRSQQLRTNTISKVVDTLPSLVLLSCTLLCGQWVWRIVFATLFVFSAPRIFRAPPPDPEYILKHAPPTSCTESSAAKTRAGVSRRQLENAIKEVMERQIRRGSQIGLSVSVYLHGEEVASVCGGMCRTLRGGERWKPVTKDTIFMSYSVCKGVSATALLTCVDRGECEFDQHVTDIWPEFGQGGKEEVSISDAVSHRAGMTGIGLGVVMTHLAAPITGWRRAWEAGLAYIERYRPEWEPGSLASYHYVSFSWIIGGIVERAAKLHIHDVVLSRIAKVLKVEGEMYLGLLPVDKESRTAMLEYPPRPFFQNRPVASFRDLVRWFVAVFETKVFAGIGNSYIWRNLCLPSSNGFFTSYSVAKMYGALANKGSLSDGTTLARSETVDKLVKDCSNTCPNVSEKSKKGPAMRSNGFNPWRNEAIAGPDDGLLLVHSGMGGCLGFGEPSSGLSVAILKNSYESYLFHQESVTPDTVELVQAIRRELRQ